MLFVLVRKLFQEQFGINKPKKFLSRSERAATWTGFKKNEGGMNSRIHHFLPECIAFNQSTLHNFLPECIARRRIWGRHDGCHTAESSFFAWILVVMFSSGLPVRKRREEDRSWLSQLLLETSGPLWHLNFKLNISFLSSLSSLVELLNEEKSSLLKLVE